LRGKAAFHGLDRGGRSLFSHEFQLRMDARFEQVLPAFWAKNKPRSGMERACSRLGEEALTG
jgi:hypothetical protein